MTTIGGSGSRESRPDAIKTAAWGALWIVAVIAFWLSFVGNPINDLRLALAAETAPGQITDTWEDVGDTDAGEQHWSHGAAYTFRLSDFGPEFKGVAKGTGRLSKKFAGPYPIPVEVEYIPGNPAVNRIKGAGSQTILEWLLQKVGLGGLLLVLFMVPGFQLIRSSVRSFKVPLK